MNQIQSHSDQKYIEALVKNDPVLIEEIYRRFSDTIKQFILRNGGTTSDAGDIFQEALITIFQQANEKNLVLSCPFEAYLYLICKRRWINELNKRGRSKVSVQDLKGFEDTVSAQNTFEEIEEKQRRSNLFWNNFQKLGPRCKELLKLSWSGKSMQEVAEIMGVSYGFSRKKKSECIGRLEKLVHQDPEFAH